MIRSKSMPLHKFAHVNGGVSNVGVDFLAGREGGLRFWLRGKYKSVVISPREARYLAGILNSMADEIEEQDV